MRYISPSNNDTIKNELMNLINMIDRRNRDLTTHSKHIATFTALNQMNND